MKKTLDKTLLAEVSHLMEKKGYMPPPEYLNPELAQQMAMEGMSPEAGGPPMGGPPMGGPPMGGPGQVPPELAQAVAAGLQEGVPPEQIMNDLTQKGVPPEVAQQVIQQVMQQGPPSQQQQQQQAPPPPQEPINVDEMVEKEIKKELEKGRATPDGG